MYIVVMINKKLEIPMKMIFEINNRIFYLLLPHKQGKHEIGHTNPLTRFTTNRTVPLYRFDIAYKLLLHANVGVPVYIPS